MRLLARAVKRQYVEVEGANMTICRKKRRRIVVNGREYLWYVAPDPDEFDVPTLTVVSSDRRLFLRYSLLQAEERHVVVIGPEFRGVEVGGTWRRFRCPAFGTLETIAPGDVRQVIEWAIMREQLPVEVDWQGRLL